MRRAVGVVTGSRSDYGCLVPILRGIEKTPELQLRLFVTGMHLGKAFGETVRAIEADGFPIEEQIPLSLSADDPRTIVRAMGQVLTGFAEVFYRLRPDLLLLLGDRFEMQAAALAALPFTIPVAHVHGGELSLGAIDDAMRHSITKLSHIHFVSTEEAAHRVLQMGEEPWRVVLCGAPALDQLHGMKFLTREELHHRFGLDLAKPVLLVTYHPVTLEYGKSEWQVAELLRALEESGFPVVFTAPNADTHGRVIRKLMDDFVKQHSWARMVPNFGTQGYWSLMKHAAAMVGNSSSGLVEAPSFHLPVVNIGTRQEGRTRGENVIDVGYRHEEILEGIRKAVRPALRARLSGRSNPYGDGRASERIVERLKEIPLDDRLIRKRFSDFPAAPLEVGSCAASS